MQDAKSRFSELLDASLTSGPQIVTRRGDEVAVLVRTDHWRQLEEATRPRLKDLLLGRRTASGHPAFKATSILTQLRDMLLPKRLSGQLRVATAEKELAPHVQRACARVPELGTIVPRMGTSRVAERRTSITDALFSRTQQRVLGLLFREPKRSFFATEIIERAGAGRGSVQRELERLADSGLVTVTRIGNQKHYQANAKAPVFGELRSLILKTAGIADPIRHALRPLARKIDLALIYGSVARGEAHAGSDVDLLVVADDLLLEQLYACVLAAEKTLGRKISPTLYTPEEFRKRRQSSSFVQKVLAGPVIPLIGTIDAEAAAR